MTALVHAPVNCPGCNAEPGHTHTEGCDIERCSACGDVRADCSCTTHEPRLAYWTGYAPGDETLRLLDIDHDRLNDLIRRERAVV